MVRLKRDARKESGECPSICPGRNYIMGDGKCYQQPFEVAGDKAKQLEINGDICPSKRILARYNPP